MTIYLLHFDKPISEHHTAQHYLGYSANLEARLEEHAKGKGARLTQVAIERNIGWTVAVTAEGDRTRERQVKNNNNLKQYCPICGGKRSL